MPLWSYPLTILDTLLGSDLVSLYNPKSVFERKGDIAIFVSNCSGERMKWIEYLINFAKALGNKTLVVDSYGGCFHNVDHPVSRNSNDWYATKIEIVAKINNQIITNYHKDRK